MMNELVPKPLYETRSIGSALGETVILIAASGSRFDMDKLPKVDTDRINEAASKAHQLVEDAITEVILRNDPEALRRAAHEREMLLALFKNLVIWVENIPNQYDTGPWGRHRPWFRVTTIFGVFVIGWRKRVINIDWSGVPGSKAGPDLFAAEDVTKGDRHIHAWGCEKALDYITAIIQSITR